MSSVLDNLINDFNDGGDEYEKTVGSIDNFLIFLTHKKRINEIDPFAVIDDRDKEIVLQSFIRLGYWNLIKNKAIGYLDDVEIKNDKYYLVLSKMDELGDLFHDEDNVKAILGEDFYEPFSDTVQDVYTDVISNLDKKGLEEIKKYILDQHLEVDAGVIDASNIDEIMNDSETMDFLLDNDLEDLKYKLINCADNAYNSVYINECYKEVMKSIIYFFGSEGEYVTRKWAGKDKSFYEIEVSHCINEILQSAINDGYDIEYYGSLMRLLIDTQEKFRVRLPDYADWSDTMKDINETIGDYIND